MSQRKNWFKPRNIYTYILTKMLIALVALVLTQVMYYALNSNHFHIDGFGEWAGIVWGFLRFGVATLTLVLVPFIVLNLIPGKVRWHRWYRAISDCLYLIPSLTVVIVNQIDVAYFQFTYRRMSSEMFAYMGVGGDMGNLIPKFLVDYWPVSVSGVAIIALMMLCSHRTAFPPLNKYGINRRNDWIGLAAGLLLTFFFVRGGAQHHFIALNDAARYCQPKNTPMVLNSPYNIIRTLGVPDLEPLDYMSDDEARALFDPEFKPLAGRAEGIKYGNFCAGAGQIAYIGSDSLTYYRGKNIVIIILESFSQEYMGCYNDSIMESFTPFLDSLATKSLLLQGRSNGKKSIESIPSVMASLPTLMDRPVLMSQYKKNDIVGLPILLKKHGYNTAFFHGAYNGSMGFDAFCKKIGFDAYYGRNEFGDDSYHDGTWGIFDEPFLQYMALQLTRTPEPFFAGVFTISSHHPYTIPKKYQGKLKTGSHPILQCVNYSDQALRNFFATASQQPWYDNTLFIIMADHPAQALSPQFNDYGPWYRIPMIVFDPQHPVGQRSNRIVQQSDIMPTLIDYLGLNEPCICFGNSIFQQSEGWQVAFGCGYHQLVTADGTALLEETTDRTFEEDGNGKLYLLKAILQQYSKRMIDNQLKIKTE